MSKHDCVYVRVCVGFRSGRGRPLLLPSLLLPLLLLAWKINNFSIKINTECFFRWWAAEGVPGLGNLQCVVCVQVFASVCQCVPGVSCVSVCCVLLCTFHENSLSA